MSSSVHDRARPALGRAQLVEDAVLRHLEEPGRELRAERETRQPLEDAEEDFLGQILGERAVADHAQDVVVDRHLVSADDDRESAFIAPLRLPQDAVIRLGQRQGGRSIDRKFTGIVRDFCRSSVGGCLSRGERESWARGPESSPSRERDVLGAVRSSGTGFVVWAVCGLPVLLAAVFRRCRGRRSRGRRRPRARPRRPRARGRRRWSRQPGRPPGSRPCGRPCPGSRS